MQLPPLEQVLTAAESYLATLNVILPLFDPDRLLRLINDWYCYPNQRQTTTWAAINVILALSYRQMPLDESTLHESAALYLNSAQVVLSEVIMGDAGLINVQILVGMVILFQGTQDLKPAATLIAVAIRLVHQLGLHTRASTEFLSDSQVKERDRVFWIAFVLDRDISLRIKQPPILHEKDIYLEWPSAEPDDGTGIVMSADGTAGFNFLRHRVRLAQIQGQVLHFMTSAHAGTLIDDERDDRAARLNLTLDEWIASVPPPFRPNSVLQAGETRLCRSFAVLYSTHLSCRVLVCQTHAMETRWMRSLKSFGQTVTQGYGLPLPIPTRSSQQWQKLVSEARDFMRLFCGVEPRDPAFTW